MSNDQLAIDITLPLERFALEVSIETERHMTGLYGRSGSGKSSFLEVVAGLRGNGVGTVRLGKTVWQDSARGIFLPPEKRGVGYVPQDGLLFPHLTVRQNLCFGRRDARHNGIEPARTFDNVVGLLELGALLDQDTDTLSGGERQRVALGRALCSGPSILLLDEPLAALDQALQLRILPFLRRVRDEFDIPMLLVSHDNREVQALCEDLIVLENGRVVARGAPHRVLADAAVLSVKGAKGFENIVPCTTESSSDAMTIVRLGDPPSPVHLSLVSASGAQSNARFVGIPADDIILATRRPEGLSARNILPGTIAEIQGVNNFRLVGVNLDPNLPTLFVELTQEGCEQLSLASGLEVHVIIKSMACTLFEDRDCPSPPA